MSNTQFLPATFAGGLKMPHYVNGRLLYADDLKADQDATLSRTRSLGQATGYGVVEGLMVSQAGAASVQVAPGLGINREGQLIRLSSVVTLALAPTAPSAQPLDQAGLFRECTFKPAGNGSGSVADGPYLLAATPASQEDGQAPVKGGSANGSPGSSPGCAAKWEVEGVQFKVISLSQFSGNTSTTNRQNLLAHWCLGTGVISGLPGLRALPPDPFSFDEDFTGLDLLSPADLTTCDLPLAVFYWSGGKVAFVDAWAARRRPVRPYALETWRGSLSDKRVALAQARFLQFQAQAEKLASSPVAGSLAGKDYFPFLPPVGFLPVRPADFLVKALLQELEPAATPVQATPSKASEFVVFRTAVSRDTTASYAAMVAARQAVLGNRSDAAVERLAVLTRGALPQAGFDLQTFFGSAMPNRIGLISDESVDFYLQQSWYDEAINLAKPSRFDIFIVKEVWLRVILQALLPALESQAVFTKKTNATSDVLGRLQTVAVSDTPGIPDRLYAMFIKRVDPIEYVPVSRAKPTTGGITGQIVIWHAYDPKSPEATVLTATVGRAAKANPEAKIQLEAVAANQMEDKLFTSIAAGDSPDLVLWRGSSLRNWVGRNVVLPLDNVITREAAVASAGYDGLSFGGKLWGVPLNFQAVALFMNQKAANAAGFATPTSLDEWRALANKGVAPTVLVRDPYHCYGFFTAFNGKVLDDSGKCALMQGGFQQALEYLVEMQDEGHVQFMDATQASDQLAVGKCVITIGGPWVLEKLRKALGDGLVAFAIPPNTREGTIPAKPLLDVEGFFVASGSRNAANAAKLALQLADAQAQAEFADAGFKVPVRMDVKPKDAALTVFRQVAQGAEPWPQQARFEQWWTPFATLLDDVLNHKVGIPVGLAQVCQTIDAG